jgi:hypothetical protein
MSYLSKEYYNSLYRKHTRKKLIKLIGKIKYENHCLQIEKETRKHNLTE